MKVCNRCGVQKEGSEFYVKGKTSAGNPVLYPQCKECVKASRKSNYGGFRDRALKNMKAYHQNLKREVLMAYGGLRCVKCGRSDIEALTLDHVENNGKAHRKELYGGNGKYTSSGFYRLMRKNGYPEGFQVLCSSCNLAKHIHGGDLDKVTPTYEGVTTSRKA